MLSDIITDALDWETASDDNEEGDFIND